VVDRFGIVGEMLIISGEVGVRLIARVVNAVVQEDNVPIDWISSVVMNIYKGKGDALEQRNYRGLKLLDYIMKVAKQVL